MFLEIQPTVVSLLWRGLLVVHSRELLCSGDDAIEFERAASKTGCFRGTHGSIRGSWPMAISGYPRGHNVGDSVPKHARPISLTDTRRRSLSLGW